MEHYNPDAGKGLGIAGLVIGIIGLLISCLPFVGLLFGLLGLGLSVGGLVAANKHQAKKGLITASLIISLIVTLIGGIYAGLVFKGINDIDGNFFDNFNNSGFYDVQDELNKIDQNFDSLNMDSADFNNLDRDMDDFDNGPGSAPE